MWKTGRGHNLSLFVTNCNCWSWRILKTIDGCCGTQVLVHILLVSGGESYRRTIRVSISDILFGCSHTSMSFPRTIKRRIEQSGPAQQNETYVVCLECGKEFGYDWQQMRLLGPLKQMAQPTAQQRTVMKRNVPIVSLILSIAGFADDEKEAPSSDWQIIICQL
jgi:hypothetical protein